MAAVKFLYEDGREFIVEIESGTSVMAGAVGADLSGIDAECGGAAACATCHVYVVAEWEARILAPAATEREMLDFVVDPGPGSRLSCQIIVKDEYDGLAVRIPKTQK